MIGHYISSERFARPRSATAINQSVREIEHGHKGPTRIEDNLWGPAPKGVGTMGGDLRQPVSKGDDPAGDSDPVFIICNFIMGGLIGASVGGSEGGVGGAVMGAIIGAVLGAILGGVDGGIIGGDMGGDYGGGDW